MDTQIEKTISYTVTIFFSGKERKLSFTSLKEARDFIARFKGDKKSTISQVYRVVENIE